MQEFLFIYNAKSEYSSLKSSLHKLLSPTTYACNLCKLTHGFFREKKAWRVFRKRNAAVDMKFLYADEFEKEYASKFGAKYKYPIILEKTGYELEVFISTEELNKAKTLTELIKLMEARLN
ncbi:GTPase [Mesonia maritima]|uniref:GTPase n=1 Tax=Mesonia maritima TaxID=1793873 RepID=A0ABU1K912_9FLAO|nr:GTPase [Mesonia maritima]MDR6302081.1 hypothetical protein [Mesonia maritima]